MDSKNELPRSEQNEERKDYETPRIESVMTPEALAREVQYAGVVDNSEVLGPA
jgi:hypothetical protein